MKILPRIDDKALFRNSNTDAWCLRLYAGKSDGYFLARATRTGKPVPWEQVKIIDEEPEKIKQPVFGDYINLVDTDGNKITGATFLYFTEDMVTILNSTGNGTNTWLDWCWPDDAEDKPKVGDEVIATNQDGDWNAYFVCKDRDLFICKEMESEEPYGYCYGAFTAIRPVDKPTPTREPERFWHNRYGDGTSPSCYTSAENAKASSLGSAEQVEFIEIGFINYRSNRE